MELVGEKGAVACGTRAADFSKSQRRGTEKRELTQLLR